MTCCPSAARMLGWAAATFLQQAAQRSGGWDAAPPVSPQCATRLPQRIDDRSITMTRRSAAGHPAAGRRCRSGHAGGRWPAGNLAGRPARPKAMFPADHHFTERSTADACRPLEHVRVPEHVSVHSRACNRLCQASWWAHAIALALILSPVTLLLAETAVLTSKRSSDSPNRSAKGAGSRPACSSKVVTRNCRLLNNKMRRWRPVLDNTTMAHAARPCCHAICVKPARTHCRVSKMYATQQRASHNRAHFFRWPRSRIFRFLMSCVSSKLRLRRACRQQDRPH